MPVWLHQISLLMRHICPFSRFESDSVASRHRKRHLLLVSFHLKGRGSPAEVLSLNINRAKHVNSAHGLMSEVPRLQLLRNAGGRHGRGISIRIARQHTTSVFSIINRERKLSAG